MEYKLHLKLTLVGATGDGMLLVRGSSLRMLHIDTVSQNAARWPARIAREDRDWTLEELTLEAARCNQVINIDLQRFHAMPLWNIWDAKGHRWAPLHFFLRKRSDHPLYQDIRATTMQWHHTRVLHPHTIRIKEHAPVEPSKVNDTLELLQIAADEHSDPLVQMAAREYLHSKNISTVQNKVQVFLHKQLNLSKTELRNKPHKQRWVESETDRVLKWIRDATMMFSIDDQEPEPVNPATLDPTTWVNVMEPWLRRFSRGDNNPHEPRLLMPPQEYRWGMFGALEILVGLEMEEQQCAPFWQDASLLAACEPNRTVIRDWMTSENLPGFLRPQ